LKKAITFAGPMDEVHKKILDDTMELFFKYGIRSITMDDVARELGMSKKTIYKYVGNKAELVDQCIKVKFEEITRCAERRGRRSRQCH
jgi:AcrR family transcriptional regulator